MKKALAMLLCVGWLLAMLAGCASEPAANPSTDETVENLFTNPPTTTEDSAPTESEEFPLVGWFNHGFVDKSPLVYTGGEVQIPYVISGEGAPVAAGVGYLLFLDGRPQPYRLQEGQEYAYLHTIPLVRNQDMTVTFSFIPVTGAEGETLSLYFQPVHGPDLRPSDGNAFDAAGHVKLMPLRKEIMFQASPPVQTLPEVPERVLSWSARYVDALPEDTEGWSAQDLLEKTAYRTAINDEKENGTIPLQPGEQVKVQQEIWGAPGAQFSILCYINGQPVSIREENLIFTENQQGKRLELEINLDISDIEEEAVLYVIIIARNGPQISDMEYSSGRTYSFIIQ